MTLKDRLTEALNTTGDTHRQDTLRAALNAGDTETEMAEALDRLIESREQKAVIFDKSDQPDMAAATREEAAALRLLRTPDGAVAASGRTATAAGAAKMPGGSVITRRQMYIGGAALAVAVVALVVTLNPFGDKNDIATPTPADKIAILKDDHVMGNADAPITLLEYAAPMCPHCARFTLDEFPALKREFIDTGKVRFIFRVFPLGAPDGAIEAIARCLPPDRYFPYIEMMFREQPQWDPDGYQIADVAGAIIRLAGNAGLSPERAKQCMTNQAVLDNINQNASDAQIRYQVEGTPTFVMNGQVVNFPPGQKVSDVLRLRINSVAGGQQP